MTNYQVYNFPWAGKLGRIAKCCLYCGNSEHDWQLSSSATCCCNEECRKARQNGKQPIPELVEEIEKEYDRLVREWCLKHNIDYEATVKNYFDNLGPQVSETKPESGQEKDFTVYLSS